MSPSTPLSPLNNAIDSGIGLIDDAGTNSDGSQPSHSSGAGTPGRLWGAASSVSDWAQSDDAVRGYFGPAFPKIAQFAELLVTSGIERGLIGPREGDRIWERHLLNCAGLGQVLPSRGRILDLGSGAGLPGVVVAIMRPTQEVLLLESLQRRTNWLSEMAAVLGLANVTVVRGRAGENLKLPLVSSVTARAVAPLGKLMDWSAPLLRRDGALYALKGSTAVAEVAEVSNAVGNKKISKTWGWPPEIVETATLPEILKTTVVKVNRC